MIGNCWGTWLIMLGFMDLGWPRVCRRLTSVLFCLGYHAYIIMSPQFTRRWLLCWYWFIRHHMHCCCWCHCRLFFTSLVLNFCSDLFEFWQDSWSWPIDYPMRFWSILVVTLTLNFQGQIFNLHEMVQLPRNTKQIYESNVRPQMGSSVITLAMTLTLNFLGQIFNLLYFNKKWPNRHIAENKHIDWRI